MQTVVGRLEGAVAMIREDVLAVTLTGDAEGKMEAGRPEMSTAVVTAIATDGMIQDAAIKEVAGAGEAEVVVVAEVEAGAATIDAVIPAATPVLATAAILALRMECMAGAAATAVATVGAARELEGAAAAAAALAARNRPRDQEGEVAAIA